MNARIEKKLSKRLVELCPTIFKGAWILDDEPSELAYSRGSRITHCYHLGGGLDYWGEGQEYSSVWEWWLGQWPWVGDFPTYPKCHELAYYPDTSKFHATTKNLLDLAITYEVHLRQSKRKGGA